jgi:hypothetical protein
MGFLGKSSCRRSLRSREKPGEKKKNKQEEEGGVEWSLHRVGGADGLPEDGVGPANLLAEPAQRVPHGHPGDAGRVRGEREP